MRLSRPSSTSFPLSPLLVLAAFALFAFPAAADWPQWRGPERDGKAPATGLLERWPEGGPPLAWSAGGLGEGFSSLAVVGERLYTLGDLEDGQYLIALSREDGRRLWATRVGPRWEDEYGGPRSTPTVAGDRVYALGTDGDLVAADAASGRIVWRHHLPDDFGGRMMQIGGTDWRWSESPLVDGDRVIVTPGARDAALVALDEATGEPIWKTRLPGSLGEAGADGAGYSSVVVSEAGGVRQYVQLLGRGVVGVRASDGELLWSYNRVANDVANIPTPLVDGDRVFVSSGYGTGAALLEIERGDNGAFDARERYFLPGERFQNHHGGMILHRGHVFTGTGHNQGFPIALELASGEVAWGPVRNDGGNSAAVTFADGHLYMRYQDGLVVLVEATPEEYRERGSFRIPEVRTFSWSHPVVADGRLYLREQDRLYVYDVRVGEEGSGP